jgi:hypothetical protein
LRHLRVAFCVRFMPRYLTPLLVSCKHLALLELPGDMQQRLLRCCGSRSMDAAAAAIGTLPQQGGGSHLNGLRIRFL